MANPWDDVVLADWQQVNQHGKTISFDSFADIEEFRDMVKNIEALAENPRNEKIQVSWGEFGLEVSYNTRKSAEMLGEVRKAVYEQNKRHEEVVHQQYLKLKAKFEPEVK